MGRYFIFALSGIVGLYQFCYAQTGAVLSDPVVELRNNMIQISYDFLGNETDGLYTVLLEVTDPDGNSVDPKSLSGDIGSHVSGRGHKLIIWDYSSDRVDISGELYFQLLANREINPLEVPESNESYSTRYSLAGVLGRSLVLPGWGLHSLDRGKAHFIESLAAYGALAGSIILNRKAVDSYNHYLLPDPGDNAMTYYDTSVSLDKTSEIMAYTAAGIWLADLVWTILKFKSSGRNPAVSDQSNDHNRGISFGAGFSRYSQSPLMVMRYRF